MIKAKSIFILGTSTDVGKTIISSFLIKKALLSGLNPCYFKPVESGVENTNISNELSIVEKLSGHSDRNIPVNTIVPYRLSDPIAPAEAAKNSDIQIEYKLIEKSKEELMEKFDIIIIEGAGGILVPYDESNTIGTIAKNVEDALLLLNVIRGKDEKDATSYDSKDIKIEKLGKIIIGIPDIKINIKRIQELVDKKINEIVEKNKWEKKDIELKHINLGVQTYYPIVYVEFFSGTRKFDGRRFGKVIEESCGEEVLRRILGGSEISKAEFKGTYYRRALKAKNLIKKEFEKAFENVDCIIIPTVPKLPHKFGEKLSVEEEYGYDACTVLANLAEIPAISIPAGKIDNAPVGMQILCKKFDEAKMFSVAKMFENY